MKVYETNDEIRVERVFPSELIVDPLEGLYGEPQQIFQRKWISRDVLRELFAKGDGKAKRSDSFVRKAIEEATDGQDPSSGSGRVPAGHGRDQVLVVEAWRFPSGPGAGDGKHAIVTDAGPLFVEEWEHDYLPFLFFRWKERLRGFWGRHRRGAVRDPDRDQPPPRPAPGGPQAARQPARLRGRPEQAPEERVHERDRVLRPLHGQPPVVQTFQTAHPEIYQQLDRLWQRAFDIAGLSQDTAAPEQNAVSGISAQTQHEIGTERFALQAQRFEELHICLSGQLIDRAKSIAERTGGYALPAEQGPEHDQRPRLERRRHGAGRVHPAGAARLEPPQLPSHKLGTVIEMLGAGLVDPETGRRLIDFPDLERFMSLARAASDNVDRQIENILDEGRLRVPGAVPGHPALPQEGQAAYNKAVNDGVPEEENLERLRQYMTEAHRLMQAAQAEQMKLAAANAAQQSPLPPGPGAPPATGPDGAADGPDARRRARLGPFPFPSFATFARPRTHGPRRDPDRRDQPRRRHRRHRSQGTPPKRLTAPRKPRRPRTMPSPRTSPGGLSAPRQAPKPRLRAAAALPPLRPQAEARDRNLAISRSLSGPSAPSGSASSRSVPPSRPSEESPGGSEPVPGLPHGSSGGTPSGPSRRSAST